MKERTVEEMKHWPKEMIDDYDKIKNQTELQNINTNYNFGEASWDKTMLQRFMDAVKYEFNTKFAFKGKLIFEMNIGEDGPILEILIRTDDYGSMSIELPVTKIKSKNCPKNFPQQLIKNFSTRFDKKRTNN